MTRQSFICTTTLHISNEEKRTEFKVQAIRIAKTNLADSTTKCIENKVGQYWRKEGKRDKELIVVNQVGFQ